MTRQIEQVFITAAQKAYFSQGVPASITLDQWIVESEWGQKVSGKNNYFGIKAVGNQPGSFHPTHEEINGERVPVNAKFRDYSTIDAAFEDHARLLAVGKPYAVYRALLSKPLDYIRAFAKTYATASNYADVLTEIYNENNLGQYDQKLAPELPAKVAVTTVAVTAVSTAITQLPPAIPVAHHAFPATEIGAIAGGTGFLIGILATLLVAAFLYFRNNSNALSAVAELKQYSASEFLEMAIKTGWQPLIDAATQLKTELAAANDPNTGLSASQAEVKTLQAQIAQMQQDSNDTGAAMADALGVDHPPAEGAPPAQ